MSVPSRAAVAAFIAFACLLPACATEYETEELEEHTDAIVGGSTDDAHAAVVRIAYDSDKYTLYCTGTLIAPKIVLTAAHCVTPVAPVKQISNFRVFFGTDATKTSLAAYGKVTKAVAHPSWTKLSPGNGKDIAILELAEASSVKPMPINTKSVPSSFEGKDAVAVGFGFSSGKHTGLGIKRKARLEVTDVGTHELQAFEGGRTICQGDSGGPLLLEADGVERVFGVTSYSTGKPNPTDCNGPGGFTRVDDVRDFVNAFLETKDEGAGADPTPAPAPKPAPAPAPISSATGDLQIGAPRAGTVSTEIDAFRFTASDATLTFSPSGDAEILVLDAKGQTLATGRGATTLKIASVAIPPITVQIRSPGGSLQSYTLRRD